MSFGHKARSFAALVCLVNACTHAARVGPASQERLWPAYLGSPARSGAAAESLGSSFEAVWRTDVGRGISGGPAITEDLVAVSQLDQQLALLDRATGDVIWRRRMGRHLGAGPLLADDRVFVAGQGWDGRVWAIRLADARQLWAQDVGDVVAPLALEGGALFAGSTEGWVVCFDAGTGARRWRSRLAGAVRAAPVPVPGGVIVATTTDSLFLLDAATGTIQVRRGTSGSVLAAPGMLGDTLVAGTTTGRIEAYQASTLAPIWTVEAGAPIVGSVAVRGGAAFALTARGALWTIPMASPAGARHTDLDLVARGGPAPAAGGVFVTSVEGRVLFVDTTGTARWQVRLPAPVNEPVVVDGRMLFAVSQRGEVVAFR